MGDTKIDARMIVGIYAGTTIATLVVALLERVKFGATTALTWQSVNSSLSIAGFFVFWFAIVSIVSGAIAKRRQKKLSQRMVS